MRGSACIFALEVLQLGLLLLVLLEERFEEGGLAFRHHAIGAKDGVQGLNSELALGLVSVNPLSVRDHVRGRRAS